IDHNHFAGACAIEQLTRERERLHLAVDLLRIVARLRAEDHATADPKRGAGGTGASAAGALLAPGLLATAGHLTTRLGGMRALAVVGVDGDDDLLDRLQSLIPLESREAEVLLAAGFAV